MAVIKDEYGRHGIGVYDAGQDNVGEGGQPSESVFNGCEFAKRDERVVRHAIYLTVFTGSPGEGPTHGTLGICTRIGVDV